MLILVPRRGAAEFRLQQSNLAGTGFGAAAGRQVAPSGGRSVAVPSVSSSDWRCTVTIRWITVTRLAVGEEAQRHEQHHGGQAQAGEPGDHQHGHQPLGALGDAHVGLEAQGLGLGPGVGDHHAQHQADDGGNRRSAGWRRR